jgi:hypothetical protein
MKKVLLVSIFSVLTLAMTGCGANPNLEIRNDALFGDTSNGHDDFGNTRGKWDSIGGVVPAKANPETPIQPPDIYNGH